ncbi:glycosyltransferase [Oculatella sp. LEGE 06141]|nr:glycosyltransferase [Oculatella sp. LEGE 06141]MBE9178887.1 glycosyltransferase [Oculatella sp. LEGE 06141]
MLNKLAKPPHFFLLFPNIFGFKGGIQVYSAYLLEALQNLHPNAHYSVFLKYDADVSPGDSFLEQTTFHCFGRLPRWLQSLAMLLNIVLRGVWHRPKLLICTHVNYAVVGFWLKQVARTPYWVVIHGLEGWNIANRHQVRALQQADRIIAVSHYTRDRLIQEQRLDPQKVVVLPNTFDADRFQINAKPAYLLQEYSLTSTQPVILTVSRLGRFARYKGYDKVVQALPYIRQHIPQVHYLIVGKGDDRPRIEALIDQLNLQDCVTLAGFVADEQLSDYYNLCDIFALPSQGEGFGIVYLEALASGKPVLAGNRDGSSDPLASGKLGCLVDPDNIEAIAQTLVQILQGTYPNPQLYQPDLLRRKTVEAYEFPQFQSTLQQLLKTLT